MGAAHVVVPSLPSPPLWGRTGEGGLLAPCRLDDAALNCLSIEAGNPLPVPPPLRGRGGANHRRRSAAEVRGAGTTQRVDDVRALPSPPFWARVGEGGLHAMTDAHASLTSTEETP